MTGTELCVGSVRVVTFERFTAALGTYPVRAARRAMRRAGRHHTRDEMQHIVFNIPEMTRELNELRSEVKMLRAVAAAATKLVKADKAGSFDEEMKTSIAAFRELAKALAEWEAGR